CAAAAQLALLLRHARHPRRARECAGGLSMDLRLIQRLLPEPMQAGVTPGGVLDTLLAVIQSNLAPDEAILVDLDRWFDPRRTPEEFLRMLADWVGLERTLVGELDRGSAR